MPATQPPQSARSRDEAAPFTSNLMRVLAGHVRLLSLLTTSLVGALAVIATGENLNYDLVNSHAYVLWSQTHPQQDFAWAPGGIGSYLSTAWNWPWYALAHNVPAVWAGAYLGGLAGLSAWLVGDLTSRTCIASNRRTVVVPIMVGGIGAAVSPMFLLEFGSTLGDLATAPLVLGGVSLLLACEDRPRNWALGAALIGIAVGLKLTNAPYAIAAIIASAMLRGGWARILRRCLVAAASSGVALLAIGLPWWWKMERRFDNPLFPFFNGLFHSPYGPDQSISDNRWRIDWFGLAAAPVKMWTRGYPVETPIRDLRWLLALLAFTASLLLWLGRRLGHLSGQWALPALRVPLRTQAIFAFVGLSFVVWALAFGYGRYLLVSDMLVLAMLAVLAHLMLHRHLMAMLFVCLGVLALVTSTAQVSTFNLHVAWRHRWLEVDAVPLLRQQHLVVVLPTDDKNSYIVESLPDDAVIVQAPEIFTTTLGVPFPSRHREDREVASLIRRHVGPVVAVMDQDHERNGATVASLYGRVQLADSCESMELVTKTVIACRWVPASAR